MDKREMIERALGRYMLEYEPFTYSPKCRHLKIKALAEQAIVIECEVEHHADLDDEYYTRIEDAFGDGFIAVEKQGTPGKAIAIIVSLEEEDE